MDASRKLVIGSVVGVAILTIAGVWIATSPIPVEFAAHPDSGLKRGQCTWYVHQRAQDDGWRIQFTQPFGRHARAWPELVANADKSDTPLAGSILVFDGWPANPYGHVAFVETVESEGGFTIAHANWPVGDLALTRQGVNIYRATCEVVPGGVRVAGNKHVFATRGFLTPRVPASR